MGEHSQPHRVAAIVPAFNEEETVADVAALLRGTPLVDEVIVVSDGSTDHTVPIARALGVKTIHLKRNHGKGVAMATGVANTGADILVFVDGDILNLSHYLLGQLIEPVVSGRCDMNIGVRNRGWLLNLLHRRFGPLLSGIRCVRRDLFDALPEAYLEGYRVEIALNWACRRLGRSCATTVLHDLKHRVKERKRGLREGLRLRLSMFSSVFAGYVGLRLSPPDLRPSGAPAQAQPELEYINF